LTDRYLLYIDLLGFSDMTKRDPRKVARLYSIIDSLNVHQNEFYKTIVFSDTILVYNITDPKNDEQRNHVIWYLIEFAEDLHHRLTGQDIYFRGVIYPGDFEHYRLKNIECFYGQALISAYLKEKDISCAGLFIEKSCNAHNRYFRTTEYDSEIDFVYLNRQLEYMQEFTSGIFPFDIGNMYDHAPNALYQVRYLADLYKTMRSHPSPKARVKLLSNWDFHAARYPRMLEELVKGNFSIRSLTPRTDWSDEEKVMNDSIKYFKRIGSGTTLSMSISKNSTKRSSKK
jgi:hypothetical protein